MPHCPQTQASPARTRLSIKAQLPPRNVPIEADSILSDGNTISEWPPPCFLNGRVRSLSRWLVGLFASPLGVFVLAALDSTLFFSLPFGIDAVVIILAARMRDRAWIVPLCATAGSLAGAALTFWMGVKIGEKGLER